MKLLALIFLICCSFLTVQLFSPVYAQCGGLMIPGVGVVGGGTTKCALTTPGGFISAFLLPVLTIAGFVSVIMIVISGIQFISSSGNPEAAAAARGRLTFALTGFAVIVLAFIILQIIDQVFLKSGVV